ncbi:MAG: hypothetical protein U5K37_01040 [Natrialbaceae archaeon]|nr:hypothetical protein [Natrialbaceae archaeon]
MPLRHPWRDLERATVREAPPRPGVYEIADTSGSIVSVGSGVLRDELKTALAYGDGEQIRWTETHTLDQAESLAAEHRERLE